MAIPMTAASSPVRMVASPCASRLWGRTDRWSARSAAMTMKAFNSSPIRPPADDLFVTSTAIADANGDGRIGFGPNRMLELSDGTSVRINKGEVRSLEFDGSVTANGVEYFVYSRVGSDVGVDDLLG